MCRDRDASGGREQRERKIERRRHIRYRERDRKMEREEVERDREIERENEKTEGERERVGEERGRDTWTSGKRERRPRKQESQSQ